MTNAEFDYCVRAWPVRTHYTVAQAMERAVKRIDPQMRIESLRVGPDSYSTDLMRNSRTTSWKGQRERDQQCVDIVMQMLKKGEIDVEGTRTDVGCT